MENIGFNIPYIVECILYILLLIFAIIEFIKRSGVLEQRYNKTLLYFYISSVTIGISIRILYQITYNDTKKSDRMQVVNHLSVILAKLLVITVLSIFVDYILNSLYSRFVSDYKKLYVRMRKLLFTFLAIFWGIGVSMLAIVSIKGFQGESYDAEYDIFVLINGIYSLMIGGFTMIVIIIYIKELRLFPITLMSTKKMMMVVMTAIFLQIALNLVDICFSLTKYWAKLMKNSDSFPYFQVTGAILFIATDMVPIFVYTLYFRKDFYFIEDFISSEQEYDTDNPSICTASILEEQLIKKFLDCQKANE